MTLLNSFMYIVLTRQYTAIAQISRLPLHTRNCCFFSMQLYLYLIFLLFIGVNAGRLRMYNNPLNNKAVELFFLVDETNSLMNQIQLGQIKIVLNSIATELQPVDSSPHFGVFFYGATSTVHTVVPFSCTSASEVKTNLDLKQYTRTQPNPSTLSLAMDAVSTSCQSSCRPNVPRVVIVFTSNPDYLAESSVRQLEKNYDVTVIVVGIGSPAHTAILDSLASYPSQIYAVPFLNFAELIVSAPYLSSLISNVPRPLSVGSSLSVSSATGGVYYTVQLNTYGHISTNDTVIIYTTNCLSCPVYASLSEPNPTAVNAAHSMNPQYFNAPGYTYSVYYFRLPEITNRFFLSFVGTGASSVTGIFNVFNMPEMMAFSPETK